MKPQYCYYESLIDLIDKKRVKGLVNISGCGFPRNSNKSYSSRIMCKY